MQNLNDEDGGGEGSEEEYDALNDETFGHESEYSKFMGLTHIQAYAGSSIPSLELTAMMCAKVH